ncbi:hypothetical protein FKW77_008562 [Venturia effusa]|uniref:Uncharacterized protein n=1 Tax=Venturia effusa TaxID=50376 RepID=A0A517LHR5_9PEZI|nr:hypothetical protein FKW77_008562 [Venturia effusa]
MVTNLTKRSHVTNTGLDIDVAFDDQCRSGCAWSSTHRNPSQRAQASYETTDKPTGPLSLKTSTVTVSVSAPTSSQSTQESTTSVAAPSTTELSISPTTIFIPDQYSEFTTADGSTVIIALHSTTPTNSKPSATFDVGSGRTSASTRCTSTATENASATTCQSTTVTIENGPTVIVNTTGGVSVLKHPHSYPTTTCSATTVRVTAPKCSTSTSSSNTTSSPTSASTSTPTCTGTSTVPALTTTSTITDYTTETSTAVPSSLGTSTSASSKTGQSLTTTMTLPTGKASLCNLHTAFPLPSTNSTSLRARNIDYTIPDCTLASPRSLTALPTSHSTRGPSTFLRLRRSATHSLARRALETSLGTKDSHNLFYNEDTAATPFKPWGTSPYAGKVFTEPRDFGGEVSARLVGIVIGGIFGLVFIVACAFWWFRKVQRRRAEANGRDTTDVRDVMAQRWGVRF